MNYYQKDSTARKYADIIYLDRPKTMKSLFRHPRMDLFDQIKNFTPFTALRSYVESLNFTERRTIWEQRRELADYQYRQIEQTLSLLEKGMKVRVTYFDMEEIEEELGVYRTIEGRINLFSPRYEMLEVKHHMIEFEELARIEILES